MTPVSRKTGLAAGQDILFLLRNDRDLRAGLRFMVLAAAAAVLAFHAARQLVIAPMEKELARLAAEIGEAAAGAGDLAANRRDAALLEQMLQKKTAAEKEMERLETEIRYRRLHWRACGDTGAFNRVVFTTGPDAPFRFDRSLSSMSRAKARSHGAFVLHPVRLEGTAPFRELAAYLAFLETRPEVGGIKAMTLERAPDGMVRFSLTITRRQLADGRKEG